MKKRKILMFIFATVLMFANTIAVKATTVYSKNATMKGYEDYDKLTYTNFDSAQLNGIKQANSKLIYFNQNDSLKNGLISDPKQWPENTNKDSITRFIVNLGEYFDSEKLKTDFSYDAKFSFKVHANYDKQEVTLTVTIVNFTIGKYAGCGNYGCANDGDGKRRYDNPSIMVFINSKGALNFYTAGLKKVKISLSNSSKNVDLKVFSTFNDIDGTQSYKFSNVDAFVRQAESNSCSAAFKNYKAEGDCPNVNDGLQSYSVNSSKNTVTSCSPCGLKSTDNPGKVSFYYKNNVTVTLTLGTHKRDDNKRSDFQEAGFGFGPETIKKMTCEKDVNCTIYGKIPNTDFNTTEVNKLTLTEKINTCCKAKPNPTCAGVSCKVGVYNGKTTDVSQMSEEQKQLECCAPCKYDDASFATDANTKTCCEYFEDYFKIYDHLPDNPSVTLDKMKNEFPICFPEPPVESFIDTTCKVTPSEFKYTGVNNKFSSITGGYTEDSVSMLTLCGDGQCEDKTVTDDSTNTSENSEEDTRTEEERLRDQRNLRYGIATCYLYCTDELTVKMPGKYNETIQIGQNFVWPDDSKYKVEVTAKKSCEAQINGIANVQPLETAACVNRFRNTIGDSDASLNNLDIKLSYSEKPDSISGDYTVNEEPLERTNVKNDPKEFSVTATADYIFPKNLFQYAPVNSGNFKIISSQTDASKYINVGYSNLPVSWNLKPNSKLYTTLKISGTFNNDMTSNFSDYKCELTVDYPGGNKGTVCPKNTPNAGNDPDGNYSACLKEHDKNYCVGLYCSADFCKKDCVNGKCTESDETSEYRRCLEQNKNDENKYSICEPKCKNSSSVVVYRTIALSAPFPGKEGKGRTIGTNWANVSTDKYITSTSRYDSNPMYEITLGPSEISKIRSYNAQNTGYSNDTLICTNGEECRSDFIKQFNNIFKSDTCGMNNNFTECDSR